MVLLQILFLRRKANLSHLLLLLQPYSLQLLISQSQPLSLSLGRGGIQSAKCKIARAHTIGNLIKGTCTIGRRAAASPVSFGEVNEDGERLPDLMRTHFSYVGSTSLRSITKFYVLMWFLNSSMAQSVTKARALFQIFLVKQW